MTRKIILASTSPYRQALLDRLQVEYRAADPMADEKVLPDETPESMVRRLSEKKARSLVQQFPDSLLIGSDQCAALGMEILGKPLTQPNAQRQLRHLSGHRVAIHTGLCLLDAATGHSRIDCVTTWVQFRTLSDQEIERYLERDQPFACAGSFRSEALGISLFESIQSDDPTALIGLPLILLSRWLRENDVPVP